MLVIVLGLLLVWQMAQRREIAERVQARAQEVQLARNQGPQPAPLTATPTPAPTAKPVAVAPTTTSNPDPAPAPKNNDTPPATQIATSPTPVDATPEPPKPVALKLQGITFHPTRPAAMISGRTLFIGDRTGEWRLVAITQNAATLVKGSQTNVLTLPE